MPSIPKRYVAQSVTQAGADPAGHGPVPDPRRFRYGCTAMSSASVPSTKPPGVDTRHASVFFLPLPGMTGYLS
jgi:hypothetical protein